MKPTLLIMAAGIGSRYGTLKQIDRIGPSGETILDYSVYDALKAGFGRVVFVIRKEIEKDFREVIFNKLEKHAAIGYIFQELTDIPSVFTYPADRIKPWGTGHAIWSARHSIHSSFTVINADDFYGYESFRRAAEFAAGVTDRNMYCLIGYLLKNTLSEHGHVSRGVCNKDENNYLINIDERLRILKTDSGIIYSDNDHQHLLDENTIVSMNMWGFEPSVFDYLGEEFNRFLSLNATNQKAEFLIPTVINDLIHRRLISVKILESNEMWFGMTYREDKDKVINNIRALVNRGSYPISLWG